MVLCCAMGASVVGRQAREILYAIFPFTISKKSRFHCTSTRLRYVADRRSHGDVVVPLTCRLTVPFTSLTWRQRSTALTTWNADSTATTSDSLKNHFPSSERSVGQPSSYQLVWVNGPTLLYMCRSSIWRGYLDSSAKGGSFCTLW